MIQIKIPDELLGESEKTELNKENKIYLILTCAHNLAQFSPLKNQVVYADYIVAIFGKQQDKKIE